MFQRQTKVLLSQSRYHGLSEHSAHTHLSCSGKSSAEAKFLDLSSDGTVRAVEKNFKRALRTCLLQVCAK